MLMNNRTTTEKVITLRNAMTSTIPITDTQVLLIIWILVFYFSYCTSLHECKLVIRK